MLPAKKKSLISVFPVYYSDKHFMNSSPYIGAQWLSGNVFDLRLRDHGFEPHLHHCIVVFDVDTFILAEYWLNPGRPIPT